MQSPLNIQVHMTKPEPAPPAIKENIKEVEIDVSQPTLYRIKLLAKGGSTLAAAASATVAENLYSPSTCFIIVINTELPTTVGSEILIQQYRALSKNTKLLGGAHEMKYPKGIVFFETIEKAATASINNMYHEKKDAAARYGVDLPFTGAKALVGNPNGLVGVALLGDRHVEIQKKGLGEIILIGGKINNSLIYKFA
jgi:hypothetical protein